MISDKEVLEEIQKELPILVSDSVTKEAILRQLELKISRLLHQNAEVFFQLLYRKDNKPSGNAADQDLSW